MAYDDHALRWVTAFVGLAVLSLPVVLPGVMMTDEAGAADTPIFATAALSSLALPPMCLASALLSGLAGLLRRPWLIKIAVMATAATRLIWASSLTLSFTWCHDDPSRLGCHP